MNPAAAVARLPPHLEVLQMITGYWKTQCIGVAAELGIADALAEGPSRSNELAKKLKAHPRNLFRLLRALCVMGIVAADADEVFSLTPLGESLRKGVPNSMREMALMHAAPAHWGGWSRLRVSVKKGKTGFEDAFGQSLFDYYASHPKESACFDGAMMNLVLRSANALVGAYDFSQVSTAVDVGGGEGFLLSTLLQSYPQMTGTLLDLPAVAKKAARRIAAEGLAARLRVEAGSFLKSVPAGADVYLLKSVLHDWDDKRCTTILKAIHKAMKPSSTLIVAEVLLPMSPATPSGSYLADLNLMVMFPGGAERTGAEYSALLQGCGFELTEQRPTGGIHSLLIARKGSLPLQPLEQLLPGAAAQ
jgi:DNA-binding HxlR family transcriptional regulator